MVKFLEYSCGKLLQRNDLVRYYKCIFEYMKRFFSPIILVTLGLTGSLAMYSSYDGSTAEGVEESVVVKKTEVENRSSGWKTK